MGRSSRLFEIIQILRSATAPVTARVIAGMLEVSDRTIYRDMVTLQAMRVPVEGEAGIGYVLRAGFELPPLMFAPDEIEAIAVGLALLGRTGDGGLLAAAARVGRKIAAVLPRTVDSRIDGSSLHVSRWNEIPPSPVEYRVMRQAIREERKLHLRYEDAGSRSTERIVCPIALVYYVDSVVLATWCELRQDFRHFRADRMTTCRPTGELFAGLGEGLRARWSARQALFAIT